MILLYFSNHSVEQFDDWIVEEYFVLNNSRMYKFGVVIKHSNSDQYQGMLPSASFDTPLLYHIFIFIAQEFHSWGRWSLQKCNLKTNM